MCEGAVWQCQVPFGTGRLGTLNKNSQQTTATRRTQTHRLIARSAASLPLIFVLFVFKFHLFVWSDFIYRHKSSCPGAGSQPGTGTRSRSVGPCTRGSSRRCWSYTHSALGEREKRAAVKCCQSKSRWPPINIKFWFLKRPHPYLPSVFFLRAWKACDIW